MTPGAGGGESHKMMLEEGRNVAALEKIKPRQLVLPAHVPLASIYSYSKKKHDG